MVAYGREGRLQEMCLDTDTAHLTHGFFTATPRRVLEAQKKYRDHIEWQPDTFFRQSHRSLFLERINCVAEFMNVKPENTVLVANATTGTNTVLKNLTFEAGDEMLVNSFTYQPVQFTCREVAARTGAKVVCVDIPMKIPNRLDVIDRYRQALDSHTNIKIAVIDWISSPTATIFPVRELVELCRNKGVLTLIDAAHVPGQLAVEIETLGADFLVGNLHKWVFTPRSCAMLWVDPKHHHLMCPLVTSLHLDATDFRCNFAYTGTLDYTAMLCVKDGIEYYRSLGGLPALTSYIRDLLEQAVEMLVKMWGTERYPIPADMEAPFIRSVRMPQLRKYPVGDMGGFAFGDMPDVIVTLQKRFKVIASVVAVENQTWIRFCAQFYNTLDEYRALGEAVLKLQMEDEDI